MVPLSVDGSTLGRNRRVLLITTLVKTIRLVLPSSCLAVIALLLRRLWRHRQMRGHLAPCAPISILSPFGHLIGMLRNYHRLYDWYYSLVEQYGKTVRVVIGPPLAPLENIIITTDPEALQHVLKDNFDNYEKGNKIFTWMKEAFGHGIFSADGESWYRQRKTSLGIFTSGNMRTEMTRTILDNAHVLIQAMRDASKEGIQPVDIQKHFLTFTMNTFSEIGYGVQSGSLSAQAQAEFQEFGERFDELQFYCPQRMLNEPAWRLQRSLSALALKGWPVGFLCGAELKIMKAHSCVNSMFDKIINQRLREGGIKRKMSVSSNDSEGRHSPKVSSPKSMGVSSHDSTRRLDLLELFMDVKPPLSELELRDVLKSLLIGGRDTTALALTWSFYQIARHPEAERKLRMEASELPEQALSDPEEFYNALKALRFTDAVVRETLRLHPSVPVDAKYAIAADVLPDGTSVGRGDLVMYAPYVMGRCKHLWGSDAAEWRPERWLEGDLAAGEPSPYMYPAFQAGPRLCLGKDLGLLEARAAIALVMRAGVSMQLWPTMGDLVPRYKAGQTVLTVDEPGMLMKVTFDHSLS